VTRNEKKKRKKGEPGFRKRGRVTFQKEGKNPTIFLAFTVQCAEKERREK